MPDTRVSLVKTYLGPVLRGELAAYALRHDLSISAALRGAVEAGLALLDEAEEPGRTQVAAARAACERAETLLHVIGPAALALPRLIAYWAVRSEAVSMDQDELLAEFWRHARKLWNDELDRLAGLGSRR